MENLYVETKYLMKKYNITANRSLGQNFLISDFVVSKMIESAKVGEEDLIIEIGPGLGTLTGELLKKAGKVIVIELDKKMIRILQERFNKYPNFSFINEDILKVNLLDRIEQEKEKNRNIKKVKVVANLPYYITTPIVMKLLEQQLGLESITIMIQREVAERFISSPGERLSGAITYAIHYYSIPSFVVEVPKESFIPQPEVESEVVQLTIRKEPIINLKDKSQFFKLIKLTFSQRRKTFVNVLVNGGILQNKDEAKNMLQTLGFPINCRGETFSMEEFAKIANYLSKSL